MRFGNFVSDGVDWQHIALRHAQPECEHWVIDGSPWPKTVGFCDLLGTPYAPVSKILSVNAK